MTFDNRPRARGKVITQVWTYGGRPDGQGLFVLGEREKLCMAWMLMLPGKPVPHDLSDGLLREKFVMEMLELTLYVENKTVGDFIKQATQSDDAGVQNVAIVDGRQE